MVGKAQGITSFAKIKSVSFLKSIKRNWCANIPIADLLVGLTYVSTFSFNVV